MTKNKFVKWDIWYASFRFDNSTETKERPVVVLSENPSFVLALKVTSSGLINQTHDYIITKWQEAGLTKPSVVKTNQRLPLADVDFKHKIGSLHKDDILMLRFKIGTN